MDLGAEVARVPGDTTSRGAGRSELLAGDGERITPGGQRLAAVHVGGVAGRGRWRRSRWWDIAFPLAVTVVVMGWGVSARAYWGDEADTVSAVSRTLPQVARLLNHVDAVHGLYYALLWPVARVSGVSEFALRLPSVAAMAAAAVGVTVIGRRLRSRRAGVCAGLVFALLPMVAEHAHDARPYAMVTAVAVLASWQVIRAADDPRLRWFAAYGASLVVLGYLELFALLLIPAHAITLAALGRHSAVWRGRRGARDWAGHVLRSRLARRWLGTAGIACAAVAPEAVWGWFQRDQIGWIARPGLADAGYLVSWLAAGSAVSATVIGLLIVLGARRGDSAAAPAWLAPPLRTQPGRALPWLAFPWLVVPPVSLLLVSELKPVYNFRYVTFCLPAVALLAGAGLAALGRAWGLAVLALVVALAAPAQLAMRDPSGGIRAAVQVLDSHERPGDAVIYPGGGIPPWYLAYPRAFRDLRDIGMAQPGAAVGRLYGTRVTRQVLLNREGSVRRIWAIGSGPGWPDPASYVAPGFRLIGVWHPDHSPITLWLYQR